MKTITAVIVEIRATKSTHTAHDMTMKTIVCSRRTGWFCNTSGIITMRKVITRRINENLNIVKRCFSKVVTKICYLHNNENNECIKEHKYDVRVILKRFTITHISSRFLLNSHRRASNQVNNNPNDKNNYSSKG